MSVIHRVDDLTHAVDLVSDQNHGLLVIFTQGNP